MTKGHSNVLAIELLDAATDFCSARSAVPNKPLERKLNENGELDYYDEPDKDVLKLWKKKLGEFAAKEVAKPEILRYGGECK